MTRLMRWLPALVAPAVAAGAMLGAGALPAYAGQASEARAAAWHTTTPSPSQVLALVAQARQAHYSGTLQQSSDLGLPQLPAATGGADAGSSQASGILEFLTASHKARVYVDGETRQRVQVLDSLAERDAVRDGASVWLWDSSKNQAVHVTLPSKGSARDFAPVGTPQDLAEQLVSKVGTDSTLTVSPGSQAGRSTWRVTLTPTSSQTLLRRAVLSVDQKTGVPLAAEIDARGQRSPAVSVQFTSIDFGTPAASNFAFTPPSGATVSQRSLTGRQPGNGPHAPGSLQGVTTIGSGWTSVIAASQGAAGTLGLTADQTRTLTALTRRVDGGRGLQTSLFSVLLANDGRVYAGAVPLSALESAAK